MSEAEADLGPVGGGHVAQQLEARRQINEEPGPRHAWVHGVARSDARGCVMDA